MLGFETGWNISNTGAVAEPLASAYGVGLATVGLFTTAVFVVHLVMQIPGGKVSDRFGPRRMGLAGISLIAAANAVALAASDPGLAIGMRALMGLGTGITFVAGVDYVRAAGGSRRARPLRGLSHGRGRPCACRHPAGGELGSAGEPRLPQRSSSQRLP